MIGFDALALDATTEELHAEGFHVLEEVLTSDQVLGLLRSTVSVEYVSMHELEYLANYARGYDNAVGTPEATGVPGGMIYEITSVREVLGSEIGVCPVRGLPTILNLLQRHYEMEAIQCVCVSIVPAMDLRYLTIEYLHARNPA